MASPVNRERIKRLAEYIESLEESEFDMSTWYCGTAACIAGYAILLFGSEEDKNELVFNGGTKNLSVIAQNLLEIDESRAHKLFFDITIMDVATAGWKLRKLLMFL
jgi:hypothetical protein